MDNRKYKDRKEYKKFWNKRNSHKYKGYNIQQKIRLHELNKDEKTKRGGKCQLCGYNKNLAALIWHHIRDKKYEIARLIAKRSASLLCDEIAKCILICANCHMILHDKERLELWRKHWYEEE